ncbi:hypothetical protein [Rhodococcus tibetensis]|uniref:Uncharacterized protein n=1 Tax=Rhodococcus tibetensis TaxID=2965064 RepID=A0ABT1QF23_9NOCA|nr:hypothetical protein [Rhodococcus sp. FXJ9.536]MCQ4119695.1 hypothetical protein [Rhodococcus sp. FXJ9.536]
MAANNGPSGLDRRQIGQLGPRIPARSIGYRFDDSLITVDAHNREHGKPELFVFDADGNPVSTIDAPWAYDANGTPIPTHYEIRDGQLVQVVDTAGIENLVYPILADPFEPGSPEWYAEQARLEEIEAADLQKYLPTPDDSDDTPALPENPTVEGGDQGLVPGVIGTGVLAGAATEAGAGAAGAAAGAALPLAIGAGVIAGAGYAGYQLARSRDGADTVNSSPIIVPMGSPAWIEQQRQLEQIESDDLQKYPPRWTRNLFPRPLTIQNKGMERALRPRRVRRSHPSPIHSGTGARIW